MVWIYLHFYCSIIYVQGPIWFIRFDFNNCADLFKKFASLNANYAMSVEGMLKFQVYWTPTIVIFLYCLFNVPFYWQGHYISVFMSTNYVYLGVEPGSYPTEINRFRSIFYYPYNYILLVMMQCVVVVVLSFIIYKNNILCYLCFFFHFS